MECTHYSQEESCGKRSGVQGSKKEACVFTIYFVVDISGPIKVMITNATTFVILDNLMDEACLGMIEWLSIALHIAVYLYFL